MTGPDRLRVASRANHEAHGVAGQHPWQALQYLTRPIAGEIAELTAALSDWMENPDLAAELAVAAEVADCLIILDHILDEVTRGGTSSTQAVEAKVRADVSKLKRRAAAGGMVAG